MGDLPMMTDTGTFVINGAERVIISQIVRSPGMYYDKKTDKVDNVLYGGTIIPNRGTWLEYETDSTDVMYVRIDKNRKIPVTSLIRAIGVETDSEIIELFGDDVRIKTTLERIRENLGRCVHRDFPQAASGRTAYGRNLEDTAVFDVF